LRPGDYAAARRRFLCPICKEKRFILAPDLRICGFAKPRGVDL
jgi:hypothetical protein